MVPKGWVKGAVKLFGDVSAGRQRSPSFTDGAVRPYLRVANVFEAFIDARDVNEMAFTDKEFERYKLEPGDILLNEGQSTELVGRPAMYQGNPANCCFQNTLVRFKANNQTNPNFALQRFLLCLYDGTFQSISKKTTSIAHLGVSRFADLELAWPPLPEQKKIAQILSTWDKAITTTEQLLANSQQQKKALMQQLLTGKKRFNSNEDCDYSVRKGFAKSKLGALPNDWKVESIKKHLWYQEGPGVRNHQFTESGIKLFNGTNIQFNKIDLEKTNTFISEEECNGAYKHFLVDDGDLLIACSGISVDRFDEKIAFVSSKHLPLCMNTSTMRFKPLDSGNVDITYFQYFMQSSGFKNQIRRQATGSAQLNFGPTHIGKCFVVFPPIEEQKRIAAVLSTAYQEVTTLQQKLDALKKEKKALMQQLLTGKRRVVVDEDDMKVANASGH